MNERQIIVIETQENQEIIYLCKDNKILNKEENKMLKITEVEIEEIPEAILNEVCDKGIFFMYFYKSEGMFGIKPDYLFVISINETKIPGSIYCSGYVYNGNSPELSEFGSFGLNKQKTERVW